MPPLPIPVVGDAGHVAAHDILHAVTYVTLADETGNLVNAHTFGDLHKSGTLATRPAAGTAGRSWLATDIAGGMWFFDNGSSWLPTGSSAGTIISSPTTFNGTSQAANTDVAILSFGTIPASAMAVGSTFTLTGGIDVDIISSATARNLVFKLKLGTTVILTWTCAVVASTGFTNNGSVFLAEIACHATGASGTIRSSGTLSGLGWLSAGTGVRVVGANAAVAGVTLDTTASQSVTLTVNESVNSVAELVRGESGDFVCKKL